MIDSVGAARMSTNRFIDIVPERLRSRTPALSRHEQRSREAEPHICPRCNRKFGLRSPRYRHPDGRPISWAKAVAGGLVPAWALHQVGATVAECPRCGGSWPLFAADDADDPANLGFIETSRTFEAAGEDTRWVDNRLGRSKLTRTITFTVEWEQTVKLNVERARERGGEGKLSAPGIELARTVEQSVKTHYDAAYGTRRTHSEEVTVTAEPGTVTSITLKRRHEWQHGTMLMPDGKGRTLEVPYSVIVAMTFDVIQEDLLVAGLPPAEETP
jgi:hypothetical protein